MIQYENKCPICNKPALLQWKGFILCAKCYKDYGYHAKDRPDWVNYLINDYKNNYRAEERLEESDIQFVDLKNRDAMELGTLDVMWDYQ